MFEDMLSWLAAIVLIAIGVVVVLRRRFRWTDERALYGRRQRDDIDYAELEQAEREVKEAPDGDSVRDWGPGGGAQRPPLG
ncbi:MAG TPA: hypothetical protein VGQ48_03485 [Gemmatimonadales bacterium]|jgi:hypothetical protein|nr:hypothetical protein [Gemmatimonadales bacterium]